MDIRGIKMVAEKLLEIGEMKEKLNSHQLKGIESYLNNKIL